MASSAAICTEVLRHRRSRSMRASTSGEVRPGTDFGAEDRSVIGSPVS
jgi:hypothetical protein